ncbi:MAG: hypothetical protein GXP03_05855, partial [Alphaproteobacteria bacterium]|nr:hypothetical protein [Alphaproteobacteria bacterium]
ADLQAVLATGADIGDLISTLVYGGEAIADDPLAAALRELKEKSIKARARRAEKRRALKRGGGKGSDKKGGDKKVAKLAPKAKSIPKTAGGDAQPILVPGCKPITPDAQRDADLAALGPTRIATGTYIENLDDDGFRKRSIRLEFDWEKAGNSGKISGSAKYQAAIKNYALTDYMTLEVFEYQGDETVQKGSFSGGHGGRFEGVLVDVEDKSDRTRITGVLCADGTGTIYRHESPDEKEEWKLSFKPFPLGLEDILQGAFSFPLTAGAGASTNSWGKPVFGEGSVELKIDGPNVTGNVYLETNTAIPFMNVVLSGGLKGIHYRDGRIVLRSKVPWQAADMKRCLKTASQASGCSGEDSVWIIGRRVDDRFVGRYTVMAIGASWSGTGDVVALAPEEIEPFEAATRRLLASLKSSGNDPDVVTNSEWAKK